MFTPYKDVKGDKNAKIGVVLGLGIPQDNLQHD